MESLGEAFDALVRTTKIAIDHHLEKVETKITDTVERKTDNFDTKIRQIESEIELHKTAQMLSNQAIHQQKLHMDQVQDTMRNNSIDIKAKFHGMHFT